MMIRFTRLPSSLLCAKHDQRLFGDVAEAIAAQAEFPPHCVRLDWLSPMPQEAQHVYWLWRFACEAGINGMDKFILDRLGKYAPQVHGALNAVGPSELVALLETAVGLASDGPAEFKLESDQSWFNQFHNRRVDGDLSSLNRPTFKLMDDLTTAVAAYIRSKASVLFATE